MRKALLILTALAVVTGCASTKPVKNPYANMKPYMLKNDEIKKAIKEAVLETQKQMQENFKRKLEVKEKGKVEVSTVEVVSARWDGWVFRSIGDVELSFTVKELNGLSVEFGRYDIRVVCKYYSLFSNSEASKTGHFYFEPPVTVEPGETKVVSFKTNGWVRKTINAMNQTLSLEEVRLYLLLHGEDGNGNKIRVRTESAPI